MYEKLRVKLDLFDNQNYQLIHKETFIGESNGDKRIVDLSLWIKIRYNVKKEKIKRAKFLVRKDLELDETMSQTNIFDLNIKEVKYNEGSSDDDDHQFITEIVINDPNGSETCKLPISEIRKMDDVFSLDLLDSKIVNNSSIRTVEKLVSAYGNHVCKAVAI
ncbi:hypothetical protein IMCC3317_15530 [Kordia antarctica]|uniref:Uncharacterized protein n=1 Tax=Kordia antarctica TaxID=1218801 RepID=A0A7L4ZJV9_9FLAO|nr:hypothetical protein [Kordia antarctica]QHI36194.1 hypothetical protein IMCC3317_15530 [Kordia antarctica]